MALEIKRKRVVVVGLGSIGRRHIRLLKERPELDVEVFEPSDAVMKLAIGELFSLTSHASFQDVLDSRPDAVWLATPTHLHAEQSIAALNAGIHVFCEKPMSDSLANARKMRAAADNSGKILNIGFMLHFMPAMLRMRQLISDGTLGNILHLHARVGTYITLVNSVTRYQADQPGSLFLDYAHQPDIFYWLLGRVPTKVHVAGLQAGNMEFSSAPNVAAITFQYDEPLIATLHLNYIQMPQRHDYEIVGDLGWAALDFETGEIKIGYREEQMVITELHTYQRDNLYRDQIAAFFDAIDGKRPPETSAADGLISTAICEAIINAQQSGTPTAIDL